MNKRICDKALIGALIGIALISAAHADRKNMRIAFSNNYAGNSWRQAMLKSYDIVTKKAVADGIVAAADVFVVPVTNPCGNTVVPAPVTNEEPSSSSLASCINRPISASRAPQSS